MQHLIPGCCNNIHGPHVLWQDCECDEGVQHMPSVRAHCIYRGKTFSARKKVYKSYNLWHFHCKYDTCLIIRTSSKQCLVWLDLPICLVIMYALITYLKLTKPVSESLTLHTIPPSHKVQRLAIIVQFKNTLLVQKHQCKDVEMV